MERDAFNLFVKHLPVDFTNDSLRELFEKYGEIKSCKIITGSKGETLGYGFVKFVNKLDAELAKKSVHTMKIGNKNLLCRNANLPNPTKCLKICDISSNVKIDMIKSIFSKFEIINVKIANTKAYILFKNDIDAIEWMNKSGGEISIDNKIMRITFGKESVFKTDTSNTFTSILKFDEKKTQNQDNGANVFVFHLPEEYDDITLWKLFETFGKIENAIVITDPLTKKSKGYGFVKYINFSDGLNAISNMNGFMIGKKCLKVSFKK